MRAMSATATRPATRRNARPSVLLAAALVAFLGFAVGPVAHPAPAQASTATYMEGLIVKWVNHARANRGIKPLRVTTRLTNLAGDRSATLAGSQSLAHPSCLSCVFRSYDIAFSRCGENIAWTSYPWGYKAARSIYLGWKRSSTHWSILMNRGYHRIGVGVTYRSGSHTTWAAAELAG
jgi:uncharacterized protein YkwD